MNSVISSGRRVNMRNFNTQRDRMHSCLFLIILLCFISVCSNDKTDTKRIREKGIEVIINQNEPNITEGKTEALSLDEDFIIDLETDDLASLGLTDVW